jgi:hypothetical protein
MTSHQWQCVVKALQIVSAMLGMWGASRMANQYITTVRTPLDAAGVLLKAVFRSSEAKGMVFVANPENRLDTIQGLGFIFVAFLLQMISMFIDMLTF